MVSAIERWITSVLGILAAISLLSLYAAAIGEPTGPDTLNVIGTSRFTTLSPNQTEAQAGNVTELTFTAQTATKAWQGFYGNISGTITLEDSSGNVFYDWTAAEPEGEIYASTNSTINWANVECFNFTSTTTINLSTEEARYGIDANDVDGIDETFNVTLHDTFYVGTVQITQNTCPSTFVYRSSSYQTSYFQNVLLADPSTNSLIFTTLIENRNPANDTDITGYDGKPYDFQLLVAEDEHTQAAAGTTTYYFWVEIE